MRGLTVCGVIEGVPQIFIPQLIVFYRAGRFPFDRMIKYDEFEQINRAADMKAGNTVKPILGMPSAI